MTRIGADLAPALRRLLGEIEQTLGEALETSQGKRGTIRIAALPSFASSHLPRAIAQFRRTHPAIHFVIRDAVANKVVASVLSGAVDIGLTAGVELTDDLEILHEATDRLCLVAPKGHPLARRKRISLADLAEWPLVLMESETSVRAIVDAAFVSAGSSIRPAAEATYMMTAVGLVRAGLGVTILPESAREIEAEPSLRRLPIDDERFLRRIALVKRRNRALPRAATDFAARLIANLTPGRGGRGSAEAGRVSAEP
jgi:DNA-binding transcriptional LysR family regulator